MGKCESSLADQSQSNSWSDGLKAPLRDDDDSGNDPRLVPDFVGHYFGTVLESVRVCGFKKKSSKLDGART